MFWKPIWNLWEGRFTLLLVNARHVKQVPGRKTDVSDVEWLAQLLQGRLLRSSFVPPTPIRELRDLTRHRTTLVDEKTAVINRIQKVLEDANFKLGAVATDVVGVSGRAMLTAIAAGDTDPHHFADMAKRRLRSRSQPSVTRSRVGLPHTIALCSAACSTTTRHSWNDRSASWTSGSKR